LGNSGAQAGISRAMLSPAKETLRYNITFYGPGKETITRAARWGETVSVQAASGEWRITVKAVDPSSPAATKAFGEQSVTVKPGAQNTAAVKMAVYTEAASWADVLNAVSAGTNDDFIVIKNSITAIGSTITPPANKTVTIVAESDIAIIRDATFTNALFDITTNSRLVLGGSSTYTGTLTLDGNGIAPAIVNVTGGSFTMRSGIITGALNSWGSNASGSVCINGGTFTMTGGSITRNTADNDGGGVYIHGGTFYMTGGSITRNTADNDGGGVYVNNNGTFYMTGGSIADNDSTNGFGGGVCINSGTTFTMTGGSITRNTADNDGGGVCVYATGTFNLNSPATKRSIYGNSATTSGNQVYVDSGGTFNVNGVSHVSY
jgi:hypothetical protein